MNLNRRFAWVALLTIVLVSLAAVIIPVFIIQPFKAQTPNGLEISYLLRRWSPTITILGLLAVFGLVIWLWRPSRRWWRKSALVALLLVMLLAAWFARQNHFEWMFNPLPGDEYAKADEASFVSDSDMVLAVENNGESVAYPIRQMAYHHLVQDVVGGAPVVATY